MQARKVSDNMGDSGNTECRICGNVLAEIINFGKMPIANEFQAIENQTGILFEMIASFCVNCALFQLKDQPKPEDMFHDHYAFYATTSEFMKRHFKDLVVNHIVNKNVSLKDLFVLEIGSNDGILLDSLKQAGIRHLGVDPSRNVVEHARSRGLSVEIGFFGKDFGEKISQEYGKADYILAANVICHIPDLLDLGLGVAKVLSANGEFIFEEPYALNVLELTSYDQFYDEHVYIFSLTSVSRVFNQVGLELIDAIPQETHGGSMRYVLCHKGKRQPTPRLLKLMEVEEIKELSALETYERFALNCENRKQELVSLLKQIKSEGKRIGGYAATSKSTTVLNYCGITQELIEFISDSTPNKIGTFAPGSLIPIISHEEMRLNPPEYLVLFAWNHSAEILRKELSLTQAGLKWIVFVPEIRILDSNELKVN